MPEQKSTLIFIPLPVISHLLSTIKLAKLLTDLDHRLSVTILILNLQSDNKISSYTKNSPNSRIKFVELERDESKSDEPPIKSPKYPIVQFVDSQKGVVRAAAAAIAAGPEPVKISGIVVDILCSSMIDVAAEIGVPSYVFFTCGAAILGLMFHLQEMMDGRDSQSLADYVDSDAEISVATYVNPVPARVWPSSVFDGGAAGFLDLTRKLRDATGVVVNTFLELEPHAIAAFGGGDRRIPAIHPVGPLLHDEEEPADDGARRRRSEILGWLDEQPDSSVVFLCFGTNGCFDGDQVAEIAAALERSGQRFLWSLRKPPSKTESAVGPTEYEDLGEVLPEGFLDRTGDASAIGKVIGWAPQMAVLAHRAVGGFVSHCGWNSILESVSCGVPMAVWPMFAEQQANAFQLVKELEIAVEIRMDYRRNKNMIVNADEIEKGVRELMDPDNEIRINVNGLREKSRSALVEGGSSYNFVHRLIENVIQN